MLIYKKIDNLLQKKQINRKEMCIETNIPYSTYSNMYTRKSESISMRAIVKMSNFFNVTVDYLMRDDLPIEPILYKSDNIPTPSYKEITQDKQILLSSYDKLNSKGQEKAIERVEELTQIPKYTIDNISEELSITREDIKDINLYEIPASAGTGMLITDDVPYEIKQIDLTIAPQARKADFALYVRGDSMEPNYYDGDIVFVKEQPYIDNGQIGIFIYDNETYIKKYSIQEDGIYLISLNKKYPPIKIEENVIFKTCGIVL